MTIEEFNNSNDQDLNNLCHELADNDCSTVDQKTLLQMYYSSQYDWYASLSKEELFGYLVENTNHIEEEN